MSVRELKAICRWIITIYLALHLVGATLPLLHSEPHDHPLQPSCGLQLAGGPQEGFGG